jgi:hypothetical protein
MVYPPYVYGPVSRRADLEHLNSSSADIWARMSGNAKEEAGGVPFT